MAKVDRKSGDFTFSSVGPGTYNAKITDSDNRRSVFRLFNIALIYAWLRKLEWLETSVCFKGWLQSPRIVFSVCLIE